MEVLRALAGAGVALALAAGAAGCGGSPAGPSPGAVPRKAVPAVPVARVRAIDPSGYRYDLTHGARIARDPGTGSFAVVSSAPARPRAVIVAVHGHSGTAFSTYRLWHPYAAAHHLGLVVVEWQRRWARPASFLDAQDTYDLIVRTLGRLGTRPGHALLHGFSKGSKAAFPLTSLDRARQRLFALTIAESGGIGQAPAHDPGLAGTRWWIYCAGSDQWPQVSGCPVMRRARTYLLANRAQVERFVVDPPARHGGFLLNPRAVERALADFLRVLPPN